MTKIRYLWEQNYGIDRFDLSGPRGFPVGGLGWITRCSEPDVSITTYITRNWMGYISSMKNEDPPEAKFHWRIWWDTRDENGKVIIHTDEVKYEKRNLAMAALEKIFNIDADEVKEIKWEGNFSAYV